MTAQKTDSWESKFLLIALPALIAVTVVFFWPVFSGWFESEPVHNVTRKVVHQQVSAADRQIKSFKLLGVVVEPGAPKASSATAIVQNQHGQAKIYHLGDQLIGSYKLVEVYPDKIKVANQSGQSRFIALPKKKALPNSR